MPAVVGGVTAGPGGQWARSYQVVSVASILSEGRASRVSIRIVADVTFPEIVTFPLKQRLTLNGALEDMILLAPQVSDDIKCWDVVTEEAGSDDILEYDGLKNENASRFRKTKIKAVELMMALDRDSGSNDDAQPEADEPAKLGDGTITEFSASGTSRRGSSVHWRYAHRG